MVYMVCFSMPYTQKILESTFHTFQQALPYIPTAAAELEFYLETEDEGQADAVMKKIVAACGRKNIPIIKTTKEDGKGQHEIVLAPTEDLLSLAEATDQLKTIISHNAEKIGIKANVAAFPYPDQPGSGLHIHLSLRDMQGNQLFAKHGDAEESVEMKHAVAGLLATLPEAMPCFAPLEESYKRYAMQRAHLKAHYNAPATVSWGGNNRTVAIRIPTSTHTPESRHIEHRVAGADADPYLVIAAILIGVMHGLSQKLPLTLPKIYGNAWEQQYSMPPLPASLAEARKYYEEGKVVRNYINIAN